MAKSDCKNILNLIPLYIDNMLSEEETDIVSRHLDSCESCRQEHKFMTSLIKNTSNLPEIETSATFHKNLMAKAEGKLRAKSARKFILLRRVGAGAAAAVVVAFALVTYNNLTKPQNSTNPDEYLSPAANLPVHTAEQDAPVEETKPTTAEAAPPKELTKPATQKNAGTAPQTPPRADNSTTAPNTVTASPSFEVDVPKSSGGGSSAAPHQQTDTVQPQRTEDLQEAPTATAASADEQVLFTIATVTVTDETKDAVMQILSPYEKDNTGYKVSNINAVVRQLAELGVTVEAHTDATVDGNYIIIH